MTLFSLKRPSAAPALLAIAALFCDAPRAQPAPEVAAPRLPLQTFSYGKNYFDGQAYLIPKPVQQVRAALAAEAGAALAGFDEKAIEMTRDGGRWESDWYRAWLARHPQALSALAQGNLDALDAGVRRQAITPAERSAWGALVSRQGVDAALAQNDDEVKARVKAPPQRTEWFRYTDSRKLLKPGDTAEFITVADVSAFLDRGTPVTLLWYAGSRTERTATGFKFFACMTGVTCFPAPHLEYASDTARFERAQVTRSLQQIAQRLGALPASEVSAWRAAAQSERRGRPEDEEKAPAPSTPSPSLTVVKLQLMPVNGLDTIGGGGPRDAMKALPDGRLVTLLGAPGGLLLQLADGQFRTTPLHAAEGVGSTRIDSQGRLWTLSTQAADEQPLLLSCVQMAELRKGAAAPLQPSPSYCYKNWAPFEWFVDPRAGPVLYSDLHWEFPAYPTRFVTALTGRATPIEETLAARRELVERVPAARVSTPIGALLTLGDGLPWFADVDLHALSPASGKVEKSQALGGLRDMFFGSAAGDWVIGGPATKGDRRVIDVFEPSSGRIARRLASAATDSPRAVARTAHGRLLALSNGRTIEVWDMRSGVCLASLTLGDDGTAIAVAFDWQGRNLWAQIDGKGFAVWPVPANAQDGADAANLPDQVVSGLDDHWRH